MIFVQETLCADWEGIAVIEVDMIGRSSLDIARLESHEDIACILVEYKKMGERRFSRFG